MAKTRLLRSLSIAAVSAVALLGASWAALESLDRAYPPPLPDAGALSSEVADRDGALANEPPGITQCEQRRCARRGGIGGRRAARTARSARSN